MRLPDLAFSEYFYDHNHVHNIDDGDVFDAVIGRKISISASYRFGGKRRRRILAKTEGEYIMIICEEAPSFWWVLSAFPAGRSDVRRARAMGIGDDDE